MGKGDKRTVCLSTKCHVNAPKRLSFGALLTNGHHRAFHPIGVSPGEGDDRLHEPGNLRAAVREDAGD